MRFPTGIRKLVMCVLFACITGSGSAQLLSIDDSAIPDTAYINSPLAISLTLKNDADSNLLGNLKIWFKNKTRNNIQLPLGEFTAIQYFAPFQQRTFQLVIPVTPEFFLDGGNTVVIWPSFIGQTDLPTDSLVTEIMVLNPNFIQSISDPGFFDYAFANPVQGFLHVQTKGSAPKPSELIIRDLEGRILLHNPYTEDMNVSTLANGVYLLEIRVPHSPPVIRRILKATN
jgi:hypothetical protein